MWSRGESNWFFRLKSTVLNHNTILSGLFILCLPSRHANTLHCCMPNKDPLFSAFIRHLQVNLKWTLPTNSPPTCSNTTNQWLQTICFVLPCISEGEFLKLPFWAFPGILTFTVSLEKESGLLFVYPSVSMSQGLDGIWRSGKSRSRGSGTKGQVKRNIRLKGQKVLIRW